MKIGCEILLLLLLWELTPLRIDWLRENKNPKTLVSSHKCEEKKIEKLGLKFSQSSIKTKTDSFLKK